jgi:hypothetical protein
VEDSAAAAGAAGGGCVAGGVASRGGATEGADGFDGAGDVAGVGLGAHAAASIPAASEVKTNDLMNDSVNLGDRGQSYFEPALSAAARIFSMNSISMD